MSADPRWWEETGEQMLGLLLAVAGALEGAQRTRSDELLHYLRLYGARELADLDDEDVWRGAIDALLGSEGDLRYNLVQAVIDTAVSRIGANRPRATFLTTGASWDTQRQAERLGRYVDGVFLESGAYAEGRFAFRDAAIFGTGALHVFEGEREDGTARVEIERVLPWEVLVDAADGRYGKPRQLLRLASVDEDTLVERFPKAARRIEASAGQRERAGARVVEAWHLPSGPGAKDGRHAIVTSGAVLFEEVWNEPWLPVAFFHWSRPVVGFWGSGLARRLNPTQIEINRLLEKIQRAYHLFASPWIALPRGARVVKTHLTNELGRIVEYDGGVPPQVVTHAPVHPQIFAHLAQLKADGFELAGVSEMQAVNRKPADLESGEALRQWNDINEGRHASVAQDLEQFYMQLARLVVATSRRMAAASRGPVATASRARRGRRWIERIDWERARMDEQDYVVQVWPTSILPATPAGRIATVQELMRAGLVTPAEARYMLEFPDLDAATVLSPEMLNTEVVLDQIEHILESEPADQTLPEPQQDLALAMRLAGGAYLRAKLDGAPEDRLDMIRVYISNAKRLLDVAAGAQPATMAGAIGQAAATQQAAVQAALGGQPGAVS